MASTADYRRKYIVYMASGQKEEFSVKAGQNVGQAQVKRDDCKVDNNTNSSQTSGFLQQKGEKVKSMAQGASDAVKNKLGMNNANDYTNKNPNNTTSPSMPGHPPSDI